MFVRKDRRERYFAHDVHECLENFQEPVAKVPCGNHRTALVYNVVLFCVLGTSFLGKLFSTTTFLKLGKHSVRICGCVYRYVRQSIRPIVGEPTESELEYAREFVSYLEANHRKEADANKKQTGKASSHVSYVEKARASSLL